MPPGFQEWADSVSLWQFGAWFVGVVGGLLLLQKFRVWSKLRGFANAIINLANIVDAVQELPKFIKRTDETLDKQNRQIADIHHEVHYNNGSSVKDGVQRVETGLRGLHAEVATIGAELAQAKETLSLSDVRIRKDLVESDDRIRKDLVDRRELEDHRNEEDL